MKCRYSCLYLCKGFHLLLLSCALLLGLTGCSAKQPLAITELRFERGNGSVGGNRFYIQVRADQILQLQYVPEGTGQLQTLEQIPLANEQWTQLCAAVWDLDLKQFRQRWWQELLKSRKQDGGDYRTLTLTWENGKETTYQLPADGQSDTLEQLLKQLAALSK